ncbi:MAG: PIN domain-containing protein [Patescibacteria group bacterium]|nr:PIN domain-containing protein [candidate division Zixibacteria bacterium]MEA3344228.1 PIN domain-containing protein [Patescibacteria group bacterium]
MSVRVVLDTNVVFEGLTRKGGACGLIIDAWRAGLFTVCMSNALAYEYDDVLSLKFSEHRWNETKPLLAELVRDHAEFVKVWFSWRPVSPDPGDDHVIDCAMNARALVVTSNVRDFKEAVRTLGLKVMTPVNFLKYFTNREY